MPRRPVSRDLKARIPVLHHGQHMDVKTICHILGVRKSLVYQTLKFDRQLGVPYNRLACKQGRRRLLMREDLTIIRSLLRCRHCIYLDELQDELHACDISVTITNLCRTLWRMNITNKTVSARALDTFYE